MRGSSARGGRMCGSPLRSMRISRAQPHREPRGAQRVQAALGNQRGQREAALAYLHPRIAILHVQLQSVRRVGVHGGSEVQRPVRQQRLHHTLGHVPQVRRAERRTVAQVPEVQLVRLAAVQPVDAVAPVHEAGAREEHVTRGLSGELAQRRRDHRRGLRAQERALAHVARVARISRSAVRRVVRPKIIVVGHGDDGARAHHAHLAAPARGQGGEHLVEQQLQGVESLGGV